MRLHVLIEITLTIQNFIADGANQRFLLHMLSHVIKQLIEWREVLLACTATRRMIIAVRSKVCRQVVLLIKRFITQRTSIWLLTCNYYYFKLFWGDSWRGFIYLCEFYNVSLSYWIEKISCHRSSIKNKWFSAVKIWI